LAAASAGLAAALLLGGCASVSDAVDSAQTLAGQAAGLASVATEVASACATASAAWVPGVSQADAEAALADAADALDAALAEAPVEVPGVGAVRDALTGAQEALQGDAGAFGLSQETLRTACSLVAAGG
jgi:uncharacterized protein YceK